MGFNLMQGVGLVIGELITQDDSLLDPWWQGDVLVEAFLEGDKH